MWVAVLLLFAAVVAEKDDAIVAEVVYDEPVKKIEYVAQEAENISFVEDLETAIQNDEDLSNALANRRRFLRRFCSKRKAGNYPDPRRCNGFISCTVAHLGYRMDCPANLWYNAKIDACDYPRKVACRASKRRWRGKGSCEVNPESRRECGFPGISRDTCEQRGCCFNPNWKGVTWCYDKDRSNDRCMVNPEHRRECGWPGITRKQCESRPGCCFNDKTPGMKFCYYSRNSRFMKRGSCEVNPESRQECGFPGISKKACQKRGCCFNPNWKGVTWCYSKDRSNDRCMVNPEHRRECGWPGITRKQCESRPGCCFNDKTPGMKFCYYSRYMRKGQCEVNPESRRECGFPGISKATCEQRGCCFNPNFKGVTWCYAKDRSNDQCMVNPEHRQECGWPGITRRQCESRRGCCFNDKTPKAKFCYHSRRAKSKQKVKRFTKLGCFKQPTIQDMKLVYDERRNIKWGIRGFKRFLNGLIKKCEDYTRRNGHKMFAIVFYGECWVIPSITSVSTFSQECKTGDGNFKPCDESNNKACVGVKNTAYVYSEEGFATPFSKNDVTISNDIDANDDVVLDEYCQDKREQNYPHPTSCDSFVSCNGNQPLKMSCPSSLWYSFEKDECVAPEKSDCTVADDNADDQYVSNAVLFCSGKDAGNYAHPERCNGFITCVGAMGYERNCPANLWYNSLSDQCDYPRNVDCLGLKPEPRTTPAPIPQTTPKKNFCTGRMQGNYPHPTQCDSYIICSGQMALTMKCPNNLWYNHKTNECDEPKNVDCTMTNTVGCFVQYTIPGIKLQVNMRSDIEWDKAGYTRFVDGLFKECEERTKQTKYKRFALVNYGECWIITNDEEFLSARTSPSTQCTKGDGSFETCDETTQGLCVGKTNAAFVYSLVGNATRPEITKTTSKPTSELDKFCVGKNPGNYEDPKRCDGYISCSNASIAYRMNCPANLWYNMDLDLCDYPGKDGCKARSAELCSKTKDGKHPIAGFCNKYATCHGDKVKMEACPKHKNFHPKQKKCVWTTEYSCADRSFCQGKKDGKYKNKNNCYGYYSCLNGETTVKNCKSGLRFNGVDCVGPHQYVCH